jgi:lipoprotein-anchoring transpeptidase ErfK/SrfK
MQSLSQRGRSALPAVFVSALTVALVAGAVAPRSSADPTVDRRTQELALLLHSHTAMSAPDAHAVALRAVAPRRPLTGERTALPVIGHRTGAHGVSWLRVMLPGRPNGHAGWIKQRATAYAVTHWRLVVTLGDRRVTAYRDGRRVRTFTAVVGKASTPTPLGRFFVEEAIELRATDVGAPYALALSARSNVFQEFDGGPGQIALHGLRNVGGVLGSAVSHGCVRLADDAMRWLVVRIGPGVPVTITN